MSGTMIAAGVLMTVSLLLYAIGILSMVPKRKAKRANVIMVGIGVLFNIAAIVVIASTVGWSFAPAGIHGWLGYVALVLMFVELILVFFHLASKNIPTSLLGYSIVVLVFWAAIYAWGIVGLF